MKRRSTWHDYSDRGIYMVTMVIEGRKRVLGRLQGGVKSPYIELSPLGEKVKECIEGIARFHSEIEIWKYVCMEDHVHILLFVKQRLENKNLGNVVKGFKTGCNKAFRELFPDCEDQLPLFEKRYHDRILYHEGQLAALKKYIDDNPRRLAIKRQYPQLFTQYLHVKVGEREYAAYGNIFLLREAEKRQVVVHRKDSEQEHSEHIRAWVQTVDNSGVLVSPFISEREKQVRDMCRERRGKLIILKENGLPQFFKPYGWEFEYCSSGLLLILAPWPYHNEKTVITRSQCLTLNTMAKEICESHGADMSLK